MLVDKFRPDRYDVIAAIICLAGVAVIMYALGADRRSQGRNTEFHRAGDLLQPLALLLLVGQEPQGQVDAFDLTEPPFRLCALAGRGGLSPARRGEAASSG